MTTIGAIRTESEPRLNAFAASLSSIAHSRPEYSERYRNARRIQKIAKNSRTIELTNKCNLFCEGCLFFEGDQSALTPELDDLNGWDKVFRDLAEEGVQHINLAGAEPALQTERLELAAKHIPNGLIVTNGTIRIPRSIPYAIHVSVWGDADLTATLRGGNHLERSIRHYRGDPRVHFIYTVSKLNIDTIEPIVERMKDEGLKIAFNYFSPTESYLEKISGETGNDNRFFRFSNKSTNLILDDEDLQRIGDIINRMIDQYPDTVSHSKVYNRLATGNTPIFDIDAETGIAKNCEGSNASEWYQLYGTDGKKSQSKCCTPNISCKTCRLYTPTLATLMFRMDDSLLTPQGFENWLEICENWGRLMRFVPEVVPVSEAESVA